MVVQGSLGTGAVPGRDKDLQVPLVRRGSLSNLDWAVSCSPVGGSPELGTLEQRGHCCMEEAAQNSSLA